MFANHKFLNQFLKACALRPASTVLDWKNTLIVAPHPEDESIGCGGAISLLKDAGYDVKVLYMTHGNLGKMKNPHFTKPLIKQIKEMETFRALKSIGIEKENVSFMHLLNKLVPRKNEPGFEEAKRLCLNELEQFYPNTILLPYRYHQYDDHQACWEVMKEAIAMMPYKIKEVEYMIWKGKSRHSEIIASDTQSTWRLDIQQVMHRKASAINGLRCQRDDMLLWSMSEGELDPVSDLTQPWETYFCD